jgi:hypothetical protein
VSGTDTQLRDLLEVAVGEPPHRVDLAAVRRRVHRRRWAESGAVALVLALLVSLGALAVGVGAGVGTARPGQPDTLAASAGAPAYYVQQYMPQNPPGVTRVLATATGAVTASVRCPWRGAIIPPRAITPAANGTFFVVCEQGKYPRGSMFPNVTAARLYRFRVTATGRVTGFAMVVRGALGRFSASRLAATPNGAEVAVVLGSPSANSSASDGVLVIDTRTGFHGMWTTRPGATGCVPGYEVRSVSPALATGQLTSSRLIFSGGELKGQSSGYVNDAFINSAGSAMTILVYHTPDRGNGSIESVVQVAPVTGSQARVPYRVNTQDGMSYQYFSLDPSGRYMMLDAGSSSQQLNGWIYHGRLIPMYPYNGNGVVYQAW